MSSSLSSDVGDEDSRTTGTHGDAESGDFRQALRGDNPDGALVAGWEEAGQHIHSVGIDDVVGGGTSYSNSSSKCPPSSSKR